MQLLLDWSSWVTKYQLSIGERVVAFVEVELETRGLLAEHAALWRKGCETTELSASEETEFTQLVQALYFKEFIRWWLNTTDVGAAGSASAFARDFAISMYHFPRFRAAVERVRRPEHSWMLQVDEFLAQIESDPSLFRDPHPATCGN